MNKVVAFDRERVQVGHKGGGKHWTKDQVKARKTAAEKMTRKTKVKLEIPDDIKTSPEILKIWNKTVKDMEGLNILDNVDADILGMYCDAVYNQREATRQIQKYTTVNDNGTEAVNPNVKVAQSYMKIALQCGKELGITAEARARLQKKKADDNGVKKTAKERKKEQMFGK
jgi:P27 family predicted phage terminase small subunit